MEEILRSILETEKEAEKILADAKQATQRFSQEASEQADRLKAQNQKLIAEKVESTLSKIRQEAAQNKEKILSEAQAQALALEKQAQAHIAQAVEAVLNRLFATS